MKSAGWKMEVKGFTLDNFARGLERETEKKEMDPKIPIPVICVSPYFTPSRYRTDSEYELIRHCRAII